MSATRALDVTAVGFSYSNSGGKKAAAPAPALQDIHLNVEQGHFVALLGANGAGKTTLISIVTGLYAAQSGSVHILGHDLRAATGMALASIGVVFQNPTLDKDLTVTQNLKYFCALQGIDRKTARSRIDELLQRQQLQELSGRKITALSGGQRRRVELVRALLHRPALLLLDEPTVGLDYQSRIDFVSQVKSLCREDAVGVLWATHLMDEVEDADAVAILKHGRVVADGAIASLCAEHNKGSIAELFRHFNESADTSSALAGDT